MDSGCSGKGATIVALPDSVGFTGGFIVRAQKGPGNATAGMFIMNNVKHETYGFVVRPADIEKFKSDCAARKIEIVFALE
jgi:hypothetical protein